MDVKKIGRIPDGGGWRAHGRRWPPTSNGRKDRRIGYDYVHSVVDDHTRLAYSEILDDERADTCAAFFARAVELLRRPRHRPIERVMTDNHWSYRHGRRTRRGARPSIGTTHKFIKPHCPWQNGKVERFNRTLATEWAYRQVFTTNDDRTAALPDFLDNYNHRRRHTALGGQPPISRLSPT